MKNKKTFFRVAVAVVSILALLSALVPAFYADF